jgi:hypothetical protein
MHGAHLLINQTCVGRVVADFGSEGQEMGVIVPAPENARKKI